MDDLFPVDVVSRILHVSTAIVLIGGSAFMAWVLLPSAAQLDDGAHEKLRSLITGKWKRFVHLGILLFLVTGFYNYFRQMPNHKGDGLYHALIGTKMLLAFFIFFVASALVGRSAAFESFRAARGKWLNVVVLVAAVIVAMSGFIKVRGSAKPAANVQATPTSTVTTPASSVPATDTP